MNVVIRLVQLNLIKFGFVRFKILILEIQLRNKAVSIIERF